MNVEEKVVVAARASGRGGKAGSQRRNAIVPNNRASLQLPVSYDKARIQAEPLDSPLAS